MKRYLTLILTFVALLTSCNESDKRVIQAKTYLILFDVSLSVAKPETRLSYRSAYQKIFTKIEAGDNILVGYITDKSINQLELPVAFRFESFIATSDNDITLMNEKSKYLSMINRQKDSVNRIIDSILTKVKRKVEYTDIFSSLNLAEKLFGQYSNTQKVLVIFSDMEEDNPEVQFDNTNLSESRVKEIIEKRRTDNLLPNLTGVKVFIVGANSVDYKKYEQIETFWLKFFKECNADIKKGNYNSVLANFEL